MNLIPQRKWISNNDKERIYFISDLHFDADKKMPIDKQIRLFFYQLHSLLKSGDILIIIGDVSSNYLVTLNFLKQMESQKINGYYVLGNHDYWNNKTLSLSDIEKIYDSETKGNKYFRLLRTGKIFQFKDLKIIGDCGWTSFTLPNGKHQKKFFKKYKVPEIKKTRDFNQEAVEYLHNEWVKFANNVIQKNENVLVATHFPMFWAMQKYRHYDGSEVWWRSKTKLLNNNFFKLYGHTHENERIEKTSFCCQKGYGGTFYFKFCYLTKLDYESKNIQAISTNLINLTDFPKDISKINFVDRDRGYKRVQSNSRNFNALIKNKDEYTKIIDNLLHLYISSPMSGWAVLRRDWRDILWSVDRIRDANNYLKSHDINDDLILYITSAVVTGYLYNGQILSLPFMRPINGCDIYRWYLYYLNIKLNKINLLKPTTIRKSAITLKDTTISLPLVNHKAIPEKYRIGLQKGFDETFRKSLSNNNILKLTHKKTK